MSKIIKEIEPFSGVWYRSCFYHCLFSELPYYKKTYLEFLFENIFIYNYGKNLVSISMPCKKDPESVLAKMGLYLHKANFEENVNNRIIKLLECGYPVIVNLDKFYLKNKQKFQEINQEHCVLIFGYDIVQKNFYVLDNKYINSAIYEIKKIAFESISNVICKSKEKPTKNRGWDYIILESLNISKSPECSFIAGRKQYIQLLKKYKDTKQKSLKCLDKFIQEFNMATMNINKCIKMYNDIIVNKKIEEFTLRKFELNELNAIAISIIKKYEIIRFEFLKKANGIQTDLESKCYFYMREIRNEEEKLLKII